MAPDCRTWSIPSRGSTLRSWLNPHGLPLQCVANGNITVSRLGQGRVIDVLRENTMRFPLDMFMIRLVLCCLCVLAQNALFVVEQPRQSLLFDHTRWQQFENCICFAALLQYSVFAFRLELWEA